MCTGESNCYHSHGLHSMNASADLVINIENSGFDILKAIDDIFASCKPPNPGPRSNKRPASELEQLEFPADEPVERKRICLSSEPVRNNGNAPEIESVGSFDLDFDPTEFMDLFVMYDSVPVQNQVDGALHKSGSVWSSMTSGSSSFDTVQENPVSSSDDAAVGAADDASIRRDPFEAVWEAITPRRSDNQDWVASENTVDQQPPQESLGDLAIFQRYLELANDMPFPAAGLGCTFCPHRRPYNRRHDLLVHIRTEHLHERRFECEICCARFKRKGHLEGHMKMVHEKNEFEFTCKHCSRSFCSDSSRRKHTRSIHKCEDYY